MANYATLKAAIQEVVKTNANNEITGALLQQSLLSMINSLGANYQFAGVATPATTPGTPDQNVFYIAGTAGTYPNFNALTVPFGEAAIFKWNGAWTMEKTGIATIEKVERVGSSVGIFDIPWEIGNITIGTNGWSYGNSTTRVRTPRDFTIHLLPGTLVGLTDYSAMRFYVGWRYADGTYGRYNSWQRKDLLVTEEADYVFLLSGVPESTVTDAQQLAGMFFIRSLRDEVKTIEKSSLRTAEKSAVFDILPTVKKTYQYGNYPLLQGDIQYFGLSIPAGNNILFTANSANGQFGQLGWNLYGLKDDDTTEIIAYQWSNANRIIINIATSYKDVGITLRSNSSVDGGDLLFQIEFENWRKVTSYRSFRKGINHRGYNTIAPENTIPAFELSAKKGFRIVETDIRFTSDNVPVLLHDDTINRTARNSDGSEISGNVAIKNITYEQALLYDFGIWKGAEYAGVKIPTFEEFLICCRDLGLSIYVELKSDVGLVANLANIVNRYGMLRKCSWISFGADYLREILTIDPGARVGLIATTVTQSVIDTALTLKNDYNEIFIDAQNITAEAVALCKGGNLSLEAWTYSSYTQIANLDSYVSGITSNNIDVSFINEL